MSDKYVDILNWMKTQYLGVFIGTVFVAVLEIMNFELLASSSLGLLLLWGTSVAICLIWGLVIEILIRKALAFFKRRRQIARLVEGLPPRIRSILIKESLDKNDIPFKKTDREWVTIERLIELNALHIAIKDEERIWVWLIHPQRFKKLIR